MSTDGYLSAEQLRGMWKDEFLPSIRQEIKTEIQALKSSIKLLTERCNAIEQSQDFISKKYDTVIQTLQSSKGETVKLDNKYKEITDLLEEKRDELAQTTRKHEETLFRIEYAHSMKRSNICEEIVWRLLASQLGLKTTLIRLSKKLVPLLE